MIVTLENTTTSDIDKQLHRLRDEGGVVTLGRVLTLVIMAEAGHSERALDAAVVASHEHPCRIIMHVSHSASEETRLDAQLRIGGDAGASEVVVLHGYGALAEPSEMLVSALLLPDAPIVAWWPHRVPNKPSDSSIGKIAHRRITDSSNSDDVCATLVHLAQQYAPGDTDISWTRLTHWRVQLAAALDQAEPGPVKEVVVTGAADSSRVHLLGAWLGGRLSAPVRFEHPGQSEHGLSSVRLVRDNGDIVLERPGHSLARLTQPGQPDQRVAIPHRELSTCLAEELRQLDPDEVYGEVLASAVHVLPCGVCGEGVTSESEDSAGTDADSAAATPETNPAS
ncbi:OpcA protein [Kocuria soli]|uniref:OpcA protein n=2 Tax=Kocuria TaxID=57493 RepID=A0A3N3ZYJ9_9MICC|nr:glucose-6-phosphate dehydrogenase assembly protein OpcA [Kocuria soli]ROZ63859.1 OpcA protein [Kocuria soli]